MYLGPRWRTSAIAAVVPALLLAQEHHIPQQPVPFSHKQHVTALALKCAFCHSNPNPGAVETLPDSSICMSCHATIAAGKPSIQQLTKLAAQGPIHWLRVYQVPGFVRFSHRVHLKSAVTCERCHGKVATRDALWKERDMSMDGCVACHKQHKASTACTTCHDRRE